MNRTKRFSKVYQMCKRSQWSHREAVRADLAPDLRYLASIQADGQGLGRGSDRCVAIQ